MPANRKAIVVVAVALLIAVGGAVAGSSLGHDTASAQARTERAAGHSFSVYTAGLTSRRLDLQEIVSDKLQADPSARPTVLSVLTGMLKQLRAGKRVVVPGAANRTQAIAEVEKAISLTRRVQHP